MDKQAYRTLLRLEKIYWWHKGMRKIALGLLQPLNLSLKSLLLDAGCGTGGDWDMLSRFGRVVSLDISEYSLALAKANISSELICADVQRQPFKAASFTLVVSFDVLYHQWVKNFSESLREQLRVLKPGGWLLLRLPAYQWLYREHDREVMTARRFTLKTVKSLLPAEGKIIRATYANMFLLPLVIARRLIQRDSPDFKLLPQWLNSFLSQFLYFECLLIKFIDLPFGSSLFVLIKKQKPKNLPGI